MELLANKEADEEKMPDDGELEVLVENIGCQFDEQFYCGCLTLLGLE